MATLCLLLLPLPLVLQLLLLLLLLFSHCCGLVGTIVAMCAVFLVVCGYRYQRLGRDLLMLSACRAS